MRLPDRISGLVAGLVAVLAIPSIAWAAPSQEAPSGKPHPAALPASVFRALNNLPDKASTAPLPLASNALTRVQFSSGKSLPKSKARQKSTEQPGLAQVEEPGSLTRERKIVKTPGLPEGHESSEFDLIVYQDEHAGVQALRLGNWQSASTSLSRALQKLLEHHIPIRSWLYVALSQCSLEQYEHTPTPANQHLLTNASKYSREAIAVNPSDPALHLQAALVYRARGQWNDALIEYTNTIASAPRYWDAYYDRGIVEAGLDQFGLQAMVPGFVSSDQGANSNQESHGPFLRLLDILHLHFGASASAQPFPFARQLDGAISDFKLVLQNSPDAAAHRALGLTYLEAGNRPAALSELKSARSSNRNENAMSELTLGMVYYMQRDYANASVQLAQALTVYQGYPTAVVDFADAVEHVSDYRCELEALLYASTMHPNSVADRMTKQISGFLSPHSV